MGITVIIITHQMSVVERICNRVAIIDKGEVKEQGDMSAIFENPQSEAAKRLVNPDSDETQLTVGEGMKCVSVSFNDSETTDSPLIADLALKKGIAANILYASTRNVGGKAYGKMLLSIPDEGDSVEQTLDFMNGRQGITARVIELKPASDSEDDENEDAAETDAAEAPEVAASEIAAGTDVAASEVEKGDN